MSADFTHLDNREHPRTKSSSIMVFDLLWRMEKLAQTGRNRNLI